MKSYWKVLWSTWKDLFWALFRVRPNLDGSVGEFQMRCGAVVEIFNLVGKVFYVLWNAVWAVFRCLTGVVIGILAVAIIVFGFLVSPLVVPLRLWQISRESKVWAEEFSRRSSRG